MKKILRHILPLVALAALCGCEDKIENRYSYTPMPVTEGKRAVLVEEYTGTNCINCPNGHAVLEALEELYNTEENIGQGQELIVVGIHIPEWGYPEERGGFITAEAPDLTPEGISPPQARVDRNSDILNRAEWSKTIADRFAVTPGVTFPEHVTATFDGTYINVSGSIAATDNYGSARLHMWIVEDNITFRQRQPDGSLDMNYVHKNVYRAHITDSYAGMDFPLTRNVAKPFAGRYPVKAAWNTENLRVVVFVEDPSLGVLNASQTKVKTSEQ